MTTDMHLPNECHHYHAKIHAAARTLGATDYREAKAKAALWNAAPALLEACRDLLDAYWDMSPLEYAASRGLDGMSDEEGERIKDRARAAVAITQGDPNEHRKEQRETDQDPR